MNTHASWFKLKSATESNGEAQFEGFAAVFDTVDLGGDVILRGAFSQAVASQPAAGYPLKLDHLDLIGGGIIAEKSAGLHVQGVIDLSDERGRSAYSKVKRGWLRGMSIGYLPMPNGERLRPDGVRELSALRLFEVTLTPTPMNPAAQVTHVKSLADAAYLVKSLSGEPSLTDDQLAELDGLAATIRQLQHKHARFDPGLLAELKAIAELVPDHEGLEAIRHRRRTSLNPWD